MRRASILILAAVLAAPAAAAAQSPVPAEPAKGTLRVVVRSTDPAGALAGER